MNSFRLALLAACCATPAMAQLGGPAVQPQENMQAIPAGLQAPPGLLPQSPPPPPQMPVAPEIPQAPPTPPIDTGTSARAAAQAQINLQGTTAAPAGGTVPKTMPPPVSLVSPDRPLTPKERTNVAVAQKWIVAPQTPHLDHQGVVHFVDGRGQTQIVTGVYHVTDIRLEPGENLQLPLSIGDKEDWDVHTALGHEDGKMVAHITVKPNDAGLSSNLVIHTSERTLSVELTSRQREYMPLVALDRAESDSDQTTVALMPASTGNLVQTPCDMVPSVPREQFAISGDAYPWRPTEAYWVTTPVGTKTCVTFPDGIGSGDLPALLALGNDGGWFSAPTKQIVNVRFVGRRFMVDEALNRFILVEGVGGSQQTVTITRRPPR
jgi:type IV secretion system protein TrbG